MAVMENGLTKKKDHFSSVQSVTSDSLQPHGLQHSRLPCPSLFPGVFSDSCPSSQWFHPIISPSVAPFSSCPQSCPASGSFPMSKLFTWGGQSIGALASTSVQLMNIQGWFLHCRSCSHCLHCLLNPEWARRELKGCNKTQGAIGTEDTFILSWLAQQP